jgi:putative redox protein
MTTVRCETITANSYPLAVHVRAHELRADLGSGSGGVDSAPGAHDYFDISLATCKAHTAMWYAKRKGIPLDGVEAVVESDNAQERQGVYKLRVRLTFHGTLTAEQRAELARAAAACPVTKLMTTSEVVIDTVIDPGTP